ncbi:MAG: hypothetical protein JNL36_01890 [Candidatus Kapabacteria bacterium]|nr:hypothetical protein [Candidatus Kapabacteria bacterium]
MKTVLLFAITILAFVSTACESEEPLIDSSLEKMGLLNSYQSPKYFSDSLQLGAEITTQIPVFWTIGSVYESYFKVIIVNDFTYQFLLIDKHDGNGGTDDMRHGLAPFYFKPTKTGIYKIFIIDRQDTISKSLVVY